MFSRTKEDQVRFIRTGPFLVMFSSRNKNELATSYDAWRFQASAARASGSVSLSTVTAACSSMHEDFCEELLLFARGSMHYWYTQEWHATCYEEQLIQSARQDRQQNQY